jgi:hypothetical protein
MQSSRADNNQRLVFALLGCALVACAFAGATWAQSGRRNAPPRAEAPVPTPTPEPPRVKSTPPPQIKVLFTSSSPATMQLSSVDASIVADTFLQRLHASNALDVKTADRMGRDAARKRAKAEETDRFVIWLELQTNGMGVDSIGMTRPNAEDLHIQYVIFEPGTGKAKENGNVYLRPVRSLPGGGGVPSCYPNRYYGLDGALMAGALETAERVFDAFSVPSPPLCGQ